MHGCRIAREDGRWVRRQGPSWDLPGDGRRRVAQTTTTHPLATDNKRYDTGGYKQYFDRTRIAHTTSQYNVKCRARFGARPGGGDGELKLLPTQRARHSPSELTGCRPPSLRAPLAGASQQNSCSVRIKEWSGGLSGIQWYYSTFGEYC